MLRIIVILCELYVTHSKVPTTLVFVLTKYTFLFVTNTLYCEELFNTEWATKKYPAFRFARVLVIFSLALVCILCRVFEQLVNSRAVTMLKYTRCNIVILMAATAWLMLTVLYKCPQRKFLWGHLKSTVYESNPHTIQELKDNISHAVAAIKITMLHRVYLTTITRAQLCIDAGGNHLQHLL